LKDQFDKLLSARSVSRSMDCCLQQRSGRRFL